MQLLGIICTDDPKFNVPQGEIWKLTLQTHHVYSTLKQRGNDRFRVVSTWNTRGAFVGKVSRKLKTLVTGRKVSNIPLTSPPLIQLQNGPSLSIPAPEISIIIGSP